MWRVAALIAAVLVGGGCSSSGDGHLVVARDFNELARMSDLIVIGTVTAEGGLRNTARDPRDLSRPDPRLTTNSQDYRFNVEETLKGKGDGTITVTSARSSVYRDGLRFHLTTYGAFVPLTVGGRYALLLRSIPYDPDVYALVFEPSRFELAGGNAIARSTWREVATHFPDRPADEFLARLRVAIAIPAPSSP